MWAWIVETDSPGTMTTLASRLLAACALGYDTCVLLRLSGARWLEAPNEWPPPPVPVQRWLTAQEFPDEGTYWHMTQRTAEPHLYVCTSTLATLKWSTPPSPWRSASLTSFLAQAEAAAARIDWIG